MKYSILFSKKFKKDISKLDKTDYELLKKWIKKHLLQTEDPRTCGKLLSGQLKGLWIYKAGNYRLIVEIEDEKFIIIAIEFGLRDKIYNK